MLIEEKFVFKLQRSRYKKKDKSLFLHIPAKVERIFNLDKGDKIEIDASREDGIIILNVLKWDKNKLIKGKDTLIVDN